MPGLEEVPKRRTLQSWKEIANYLGVTVRSVQRWEKISSLPVYRQGGGKSGRVFAHPDELDRWVAAGGAGKAEEDAAEGSARPAWVSIGVPAAIGAMFLLATVFVWRAGVIPWSRTPHGWSLNGSKLTILDWHDRVCWEKRIPQLDPQLQLGARDKVLIGDTDSDGSPEVLLNFLPEHPKQAKASLMCFDAKGRLRWQFQYGGPKIFGTRKFEPTYNGRLIRPVRVAGRSYVLTVANHNLWYPAQVALLDASTGGLVEEYWHPGSIYLGLLHDVDADQQDEFVFGAINNPGEGLGHAALGILKLPFSKAGKKEAKPGDPLQPITGGGEFAYALFPHPDVNHAMAMLPGVAALQIDEFKRILFESQTPESGAIVYYLDFNLNVLEYRFSDNFAPLHNRLEAQHLLNHSLTPAESESLGRVARFPFAPDGNSPELKRLWKW